MRRRQWTALGLVAFVTICLFSLFRLPPDQRPISTSPLSNNPPPPAPEAAKPPPVDDGPGYLGPPPDRRPKPATGTASHPMWHLMTDAEKDFQTTLKRQSKTLEDAVTEYKRRYGIPPPPNFDKWFEFAKANGVQLIDEFDMIHEMLTPFWGLKPKTIRERAREALGFDNKLLGLLIRDHKISHIQGGQDWQREATAGMIEKFIQWLPSMDLAFNIHDEPRVVVPHEDLARLVKRAKDVNMPKANSSPNPSNAFTKRHGDLSEGKIIEEYKRTRFNVFAHQPTWTHSRMSCPPDSPSRGLEEDELSDDLSKYGVSELGFIYNITAMSDICLSPSLGETFGFFDRPNAYNIVHDLFPILFRQARAQPNQTRLDSRSVRSALHNTPNDLSLIAPKPTYEVPEAENLTRAGLISSNLCPIHSYEGVNIPANRDVRPTAITSLNSNTSHDTTPRAFFCFGITAKTNLDRETS